MLYLITGSGSTVEAVSSALQRICEATKAEELTVMWNCLYKETKESIENKNSAHLTRLLTLLTSAVRAGKGLKVYGELFLNQARMKTLICMIVLTVLFPCQCVTDYKYLDGLVNQIVQTFMDSSDVLNKVQGLMLGTIDIPRDVNEMESIASQWTPIFSLNSLRYNV